MNPHLYVMVTFAGKPVIYYMFNMNSIEKDVTGSTITDQ